MTTDGATVRGRAIVTAARRVLGAIDWERLETRAMALTYLSLFAVVPALVVAFSVVQAFTGTEALWLRLDEFLIANLAVGARSSIEPHLAQFVRNAHAASAGVVGGALLVYSAVSLFSNVEAAVNDIWHVRRRRPFRQMMLTYWAALTLGPVLLAGSLTLGHAVERYLQGAPIGHALAAAGAVLLTCAFFAVVYLIAPATKVRAGAAVAGGLVAGLAFEVAKAVYTFAVGRFFRYHAVYGSLAAVPIFLLWLYLSWSILLFGARIAFVAQHARVLLRGHAPQATPQARELLAAQALYEIAVAFHRGAAAPQPEEVADRLDVLPEPVRDVLAALRQAGLVIDGASGGILPARPLAHMTLGDVRAAVSGDLGPAPEQPASSPVEAQLAAADAAAGAALAQVTYEALCERATTSGFPLSAGGGAAVAAAAAGARPDRAPGALR